MAKETMSDRQILEMLYLRDVKGKTMGEIARIMRMSRNKVLGVYHRCQGPSSAGDGSMPERWWEEGLRRREALISAINDIDI